MAVKNKTQETEASVEEYIENVADEQKRKDCVVLTGLFQKASECQPKMWGTAIVGFGSYHYKYDSGHEGDAPLTGFAARSSGISLYLGTDYKDRDGLMSRFGKYKIGKACITIKKLADINEDVLFEMVRNSVQDHREKYL